MFSDFESIGGSSEFRFLDLEFISLGDFYWKFLWILFSGIMFFVDDLDERELFFFLEIGFNFFGIFKKILMLKVVFIYKFCKLRFFMKCRDCEGIVVF